MDEGISLGSMHKLEVLSTSLTENRLLRHFQRFAKAGGAETAATGIFPLYLLT